ncbi:MAG: helix-turn-helix domain-containing protein [Candidatus Izemoplasmatales bacterium]|nr:helix-turn-helix domain-containing protein [Candidatus Izemoplasmatales bacterium]
MFVITNFKLYTIEEISDILKVTPRTIYNYIKSGNLKAVKIGKYWRVTDSALQEFIENGTTK